MAGGKDDQVPPITFRILLHLKENRKKNEVIFYPKVTPETELKTYDIFFF
jgi:hypothetical protein